MLFKIYFSEFNETFRIWYPLKEYHFTLYADFNKMYRDTSHKYQESIYSIKCKDLSSMCQLDHLLNRASQLVAREPKVALGPMLFGTWATQKYKEEHKKIVPVWHVNH